MDNEQRDKKIAAIKNDQLREHLQNYVEFLHETEIFIDQLIEGAIEAEKTNERAEFMEDFLPLKELQLHLDTIRGYTAEINKRSEIREVAELQLMKSEERLINRMRDILRYLETGELTITEAKKLLH